MTAIRTVVVLESSVIAFFAYFLYQQYVNDQYFRAYLEWQNLVLLLGVGMAALAFLAGVSIYVAFVQPVPVDLRKEEPVKEVVPVVLPKPPAPAPAPPPEVKIVIPPASGLAKFIQDRTKKYQRVTVQGTAEVSEVLDRSREPKARDESD